MHFYTYNDWVAHSYSTTNERDLSKGQTKIVDVTDRIGQADDQFKRINIFSRYTPTVSVRSTDINPSFDFYSSNVNCNLGCLYKVRGTYSGPNSSRYGNSGCIQSLGDALGSQYPSSYQWPYLFLIDEKESHLYPELNGGECLTINVEPGYFEMFEKILVFQSIYSGCISYEESQSSLEIQFGKIPGELNWNPSRYDYRINTTLYSATSLMIVGALITFDVSGSGSSQKRSIIIENISEFVYGHVDMAERFGWGKIRWKSYQPPKSAKVMPDSIMHYSMN